MQVESSSWTNSLGIFSTFWADDFGKGVAWNPLEMISGRTPGATALLVLSSKSESLGTTSPIVFISLHRCCVCYLHGFQRLNPGKTTWRNARFVSQATQGSTQNAPRHIHSHTLADTAEVQESLPLFPVLYIHKGY